MGFDHHVAVKLVQGPQGVERTVRRTFELHDARGNGRRCGNAVTYALQQAIGCAENFRIDRHAAFIRVGRKGVRFLRADLLDLVLQFDKGSPFRVEVFQERPGFFCRHDIADVFRCGVHGLDLCICHCNKLGGDHWIILCEEGLRDAHRTCRRCLHDEALLELKCRLIGKLRNLRFQQARTVHGEEARHAEQCDQHREDGDQLGLDCHTHGRGLSLALGLEEGCRREGSLHVDCDGQQVVGVLPAGRIQCGAHAAIPCARWNGVVAIRLSRGCAIGGCGGLGRSRAETVSAFRYSERRGYEVTILSPWTPGRSRGYSGRVKFWLSLQIG
ncbi:hypothetical protein PAM7066_03321 [Palleronia marisminoris]|uniref:Uncharacterized protein n=1 Tax=Palleronia marisminoris TaxID=315423 RepID=A0A1Y5TKP2_9RHOB|nr:hypothetical protein PAM7066_03321 [Palleronia marisminoris]